MAQGQSGSVVSVGVLLAFFAMNALLEFRLGFAEIMEQTGERPVLKGIEVA
jgi:hypothetical protein